METKYIIILCLVGIAVLGFLMPILVGILAEHSKERIIKKWDDQDYSARISTTYKGFEIILWVYNVYGHDYDLESFHDSENSRRIYGLITKWACFPSFHIFRSRRKWQFYDDALNETLDFAKGMIDSGSIDRWFDTVAHYLDGDQAYKFMEKQNHEEFEMLCNRP